MVKILSFRLSLLALAVLGLIVTLTSGPAAASEQAGTLDGVGYQVTVPGAGSSWAEPTAPVATLRRLAAVPRLPSAGSPLLDAGAPLSGARLELALLGLVISGLSIFFSSYRRRS